MDFLLRVDESALKTPLELYKRNLKEASRLHEKQVVAVDEHVTKMKPGSDNTLEMEQLIASLEAYEAKLAEKVASGNALKARIEKRIEFYNDLDKISRREADDGREIDANMTVLPQNAEKSSNKEEKNNKNVTFQNSESLNNWYSDKFNVYIAQYLLKNADFSAIPDSFLQKPVDFQDLSRNSEEVSHYIMTHPSLLFLRCFDLGLHVDYELIIRCNLITQDILQSRSQKKLLAAWIKENEKYLKKTRSSLKFEYLLSVYVSMIKDSVLGNENLVGISNYSYHPNYEVNYIDALTFLKSQLFPINKEEHNKYIADIQDAMGLLTLPNVVILLFIKYEKFLVKNFYKKKYCLANMSSSFYSPSSYTNYKVVVTKKLVNSFLEMLPVTIHHKVTFKKYLLNKNLAKYFKLLSFKRANYINSLFVSVYNELYSLKSSSMSFQLLLSLGLSIMKTRNCITTSDLKKISPAILQSSHLTMGIQRPEKAAKSTTSTSQEIVKTAKFTGKARKESRKVVKAIPNHQFRERLIKTKSKHCPICSSMQLIKLSEDMLFSHHSKSELTYKHPVVLPNNNIYDQESLLKFNRFLRNTFMIHIKGDYKSEEDDSVEAVVSDYSSLYNAVKQAYFSRATKYKGLVDQEFTIMADPLTSECFPYIDCCTTVFPT